MSEFMSLMEEYAKVSDESDMHHLTRVLDHLFCDLEEMHPEMYEKYMTKVKLSNKHIPWDRHQAEHAIKKMRNKDGTEGEHWTYEQTTEVLEKKGYDHPAAEWYVAMNMCYSDYFSPDFSTDVYIRLACDFLNDSDAPSNKMKRYWVAMHY